MSDAHQLLLRAQRILLGVGIGYLATMLLFTAPFLQKHALYMHKLKFPWWTHYDAPQKYSLAPHKTVNMKISASDGVDLGAWFVYSDPYFVAHPPAELSIRDAIAQHPTILFLHGNAATRAAPFRVLQYQAFASRLHTNVFTIDYRGFGDSAGDPSEAGLTLDALAAWNFLLSQGATPQDIVVVGLSLGTGVTSNLGAALAQQGVQPRGIAVMAPFSDVATLLPTYSIAGFAPVFKPLAMYPFAMNALFKYLKHPFRSIDSLPRTAAPILLVHSEDDWDIPCMHSEALFEALLQDLLPALPPLPTSPSDINKEAWDTFMETKAARQQRRDEVVSTSEIEGFASVSAFTRSAAAGGAQVMFVKTKWGGHDRVGLNEGVQDIMKEFFGLPCAYAS